ncbi:MAG TPA: hypothetical protein DEB17_00225 [Chlorobaculum sp.]|uniref:Uncharacterized protein n=1 Tax=Chlorobaculum tepidum (strain ATCC 49652 / DSM 12025 / NBRC 103806 / TLS) TaxID=194439 RepID=Q8KC56_CHLTE|nr:hypothetical protein CT1570 [Chlorobaculum tepidum TLS]HBU22425.1 hypothetical protein [Chlorobaculum sp.]
MNAGECSRQKKYPLLRTLSERYVKHDIDSTKKLAMHIT